MGRPSERDATLKEVAGYLRKAEVASPKDMPITFAAIARATGIDRRTVKRHAAKVIEKAKKVQAREQMPPARQEEEAYLDSLREKDEEIAAWKAKYQAMLARSVIIEVNAQRLGIDPDELYREVPRPDRSVSRAGRGGSRGKRR